MKDDDFIEKPVIFIKHIGTRNKRTYGLFSCGYCGKEFEARKDEVKKGSKKSCGCKTKEMRRINNTRHGLSYSKLYKKYANLNDRCNRVKNNRYYAYGAKGIKNEFESFESFAKWALDNGYKEGLTIERIDINKNYSPENCTWIAKEKQARNKSNNRFIEYKGQKKCLAEWAEIANVNRSTLSKRLENGYTMEQAMNKPVNRKQRNTDIHFLDVNKLSYRELFERK